MPLGSAFPWISLSDLDRSLTESGNFDLPIPTSFENINVQVCYNHCLLLLFITQHCNNLSLIAGPRCSGHWRRRAARRRRGRTSRHDDRCLCVHRLLWLLERVLKPAAGPRALIVPVAQKVPAINTRETVSSCDFCLLGA